MSNIAYLPRQHYAGPVLVDPASDGPKVRTQLEELNDRARAAGLADSHEPDDSASPIVMLMLGAVLIVAVVGFWLAVTP